MRATPYLTLVLALGSIIQPVLGQTHGSEAASAVEGVDYRVYDRTGRPASLSEIIEAAGPSEVLLVGEEHGDMPGHAFEAALLQRSIESSPERQVVLSLEMFERDVQYILDEYLNDLITETHFLESARPWDDYEARYRPLVETAKSHGAPVVAANAPRRYVNRVTRGGPESLESLSDLARSHLPPLPYPGPSERYRAEWDALMAEAMQDAGALSEESVGAEEGTPPEVEHVSVPISDSGESSDSTAQGDAAESGTDHSVSSNAIYSQALWDASMGHAITTALVDHLGGLVVHFAGSFHVGSGTGIPERIEDYRPGTRVTTVVITKVDDIESWSAEDHGALADFVVLTPKPAEAEVSGGS